MSISQIVKMVGVCDAYDAAGRLVKEGNKTYRYGYLDKVLSVTDGDTTRTYTYHADGQLASASCDGIGRAGAPRTPQTETFLWDSLALIRRGDEQFVNEPHVGGDNPVASSKGTSYFNDMLGTTVGARSKGGRYSAAALSAFGESMPTDTSNSQLTTHNSQTFFTGKPFVEGLGHAFLMRNYRASLAKWQTADPMGYPNGWNALAYCNNGVTGAVDIFGAAEVFVADFQTRQNIGNVNQLTVGSNVANATGDQNGSCQDGYSYSKTSNYKLTLTIYIDVNIDANAKESAQFAKGAVAEYSEHQGNLLVASLAPVKEAIQDHELGHAECIISTFRTYLKTKLDELELNWRNSGGGVNWLTDDKVNAVYGQAYAQCKADIANAANSPTISWFEASSDWFKIKDGSVDHVWKWIKE